MRIRSRGWKGLGRRLLRTGDEVPWSPRSKGNTQSISRAAADWRRSGRGGRRGGAPPPRPTGSVLAATLSHASPPASFEHRPVEKLFAIPLDEGFHALLHRHFRPE